MITCSVVDCKILKQNSKTPLFQVLLGSKLEWTNMVKNINNQTKALNYVCRHVNDVHTTHFSLTNNDTFVSINIFIYAFFIEI